MLLVLITDDVDWWRAALMAAPEARPSGAELALLLGDTFADVGRMGSMGCFAPAATGYWRPSIVWPGLGAEAAECAY